MKTPTVVLMLAGLAVTAAGCGTENSPSGTDDALRDRTFVSSAVTEDGKPKKLAAATKVRLQFTDDGRLIADAGCNSMQSPVSTAGGTIAVEDLAMTGLGCDPARHAQDEWLSKLLQDNPAWAFESNQLTVSAGTTKLVLSDATQPDLALEGTRWTLDSLLQGEAVSHQPGMEKAHLVISAGKVSGSTGCNTLNGPAMVSGATVSDATVKLGPVGTTRKACTGEDGKVEQAMLKLLQGSPLTFTIDGAQLTLRAADQTGLILKGGK